MSAIDSKRQKTSIMRGLTPLPRRYSYALTASSASTSFSSKRSARQSAALPERKSRASSPGVRPKSGIRLKGAGSALCAISTALPPVTSVITFSGCHVMAPSLPSRARNAGKLRYSLCTRCGPMSITSPLARSVTLCARPPSRPLRSRTSGFTPFSAREIAPQLQSSSETLLWTPVPDGLAARLEVTSPGAAALRVALATARVAPGMELRFAGSARADVVYGPFTARDVDRSLPSYWSPVLEGDTAIVEIFVSGNTSIVDRAPTLTEVSHLFVSPADPKADSLAKIGESGFCEVNLVCRSAADTALANTGRSVARMTFQETPGGGTFLCTGTLLRPLDNSFTPYFYTAAHC